MENFHCPLTPADPKPEAPTEIRGPFSSIPTTLPGVRLCEHLIGRTRTFLGSHHRQILRVDYPELPDQVKIGSAPGRGAKTVRAKPGRRNRLTAKELQHGRGGQLIPSLIDSGVSHDPPDRLAG